MSAEDRVTVDPDVAILHVGFQTLPMDAKDAYAAGAKTSNDIVNALKQAGIPERSIRSEWQRLDSVYNKPHKFTLAQQWTVKVPPERAAEILDVAVTAGATSSGQIDWTVQDEQALEDRALEGAAERARAQAAVLAKGMDVKLGALVYVTNQVSAPEFPMRMYANNAAPMAGTAAPPPLAIEPRKVVSTATVYAVFSHRVEVYRRSPDRLQWGSPDPHTVFAARGSPNPGLQQPRSASQPPRNSPRQQRNRQRHRNPSSRFERVKRRGGDYHRLCGKSLHHGPRISNEFKRAPAEDAGGERESGQHALPWEGNRPRRHGLFAHPLHHCRCESRRGNDLILARQNLIDDPVERGPIGTSLLRVLQNALRLHHEASCSASIPAARESAFSSRRCGKRRRSNSRARPSRAFTVPSGRCMVRAAALTSIS